MNQGKYDMVKQEMERVNTDILRISELKLTGMVNLTQMALYLLLSARIPLSTKQSKMQYMGTISEMSEWSWFVSKAIHSISE